PREAVSDGGNRVHSPLRPPRDQVLELGCGYGCICFELEDTGAHLTGIDTERESITLARELAGSASSCDFREADALDTGFEAGQFDSVLCLQNGICAFGVEPPRLLQEALRVCRPGGRLFFSSYAEAFWPHRLAWFEAQAAEGLLGEIDREATGDGVIVCKDGFRAGAISPSDFRDLGKRFGLRSQLSLVDDATQVCIYSQP
ncbi:MAG: class I SAM-dependent methyltransferase, partial [bacterium]|nr:class I SAM-dependent methyltransferase [bacterium]